MIATLSINRTEFAAQLKLRHRIDVNDSYFNCGCSLDFSIVLVMSVKV